MTLVIKKRDIKCKLIKEKAVIDKNVICEMDVIKDESLHIFKARGAIVTSISLPITSSDLEGYTKFELWFDEPIEGTSKILIVITEVDWKDKKRARFESISYKRTI
jgi:hypothetical protein